MFITKFLRGMNYSTFYLNISKRNFVLNHFPVLIISDKIFHIPVVFLCLPNFQFLEKIINKIVEKTRVKHLLVKYFLEHYEITVFCDAIAKKHESIDS